jgi:hypothetical protein
LFKISIAFLTKFHEFCGQKQFGFTIRKHIWILISRGDEKNEAIFYFTVGYIVYLGMFGAKGSGKN